LISGRPVRLTRKSYCAVALLTDLFEYHLPIKERWSGNKWHV
jgi:hypothetical protein